MKVQSLFTALEISSSGMSAQRSKLNTISSNIANANTTRTESGEAYRRKVTVMEAQETPAFEHVLRQQRLKLATTHQAHFPFRPTVQQIGQSYETVSATTQEDFLAFQQVYNPNHPDADENGYVAMPNISVVSEMIDMITASRAYEANLSSIDAAKEMARSALNI